MAQKSLDLKSAVAYCNVTNFYHFNFLLLVCCMHWGNSAHDYYVELLLVLKITYLKKKIIKKKTKQKKKKKKERKKNESGNKTHWMSWTFLKQQGLILSMLKNKFLSFLQFSEPCSWLVIFTFKCGISEFIDETERWHGSLRGDKFLQNMPKEQDCIVIANNKVIFHLEEKKNKNDNVRVHISILKLQYLSWSPFGKNSSMEGQNLYDGQCHISKRLLEE